MATTSTAETFTRELIEQHFKSPGAYWQNDEYFCLSPLREDKHIGSFSINAASGEFYDFATGDRGHVSQLLSEADHQMKSLREIASQSWATDKWGDYVRHWTYRDQAGRPILAAVRYQPQDGSPKSKNIVPYHPAGGTWKTGYPKGKARPLLNLDQLARNPNLPVLLVAGEKCASVSAPGFVPTTWPGGEKALHKADLSLLKNRTVFYWPDADTTGAATIPEIRKLLPNVKVLQVPDGKPQGWDIADASESEMQAVLDSAKSSRRFRLLPASDLEFVSANWLVDNFLERESFAELFGDPGSYKTFVAMSMGLSVASGKPFYGHDVQQGPVVYICGEGRNGILKRLLAWARYNHVNLGELPLYISSMPTALIDPVIMAQTIEALADDLPKPPVLVIVDTLNRNIGAGDENSAVDMTASIAAMDNIRERFGAAVLLVHHSGHMSKDRSRGHSALKAALDFEYRTDKDDSGVIRLVCTKIKDYEAPEPMAFRPRTVELETPAGDSVYSIVLDATSYEPPSKTGKVGRGKNQTLALEVLHNALIRHQQNVADSGRDPDTARVSIDAWRDACADAGMDRRAFYKVKNSLSDSGQIHFDHGFVSPVTRPVPMSPSIREGDKGDACGYGQSDKGDAKGTQTGQQKRHTTESIELEIF